MHYQFGMHCVIKILELKVGKDNKRRIIRLTKKQVLERCGLFLNRKSFYSNINRLVLS